MILFLMVGWSVGLVTGDVNVSPVVFFRDFGVLRGSLGGLGGSLGGPWGSLGGPWGSLGGRWASPGLPSEKLKTHLHVYIDK